MRKTVRKEVLLILICSVLALGLGAAYGQAMFFLVIFLAAYTARSLVYLSRMEAWLTKPKGKTPEAYGLWDEVHYHLHHLYARQKKSKKRLRKILRRYKESTLALPYATIVLDDRDVLQWFNPAAESLFGFKAKRDVGQRIANLIRVPLFLKYMEEKHFEQPLELSLGTRNLRITLTAYGDGQALLIARDDTQTIALDRMRRNFIANASHELRTPLTVISGFLETMVDHVPSELLAPVEKMRLEADRMKAIIADLLVLARLESAELDRDNEKINISALIGEITGDVLTLDKKQHCIEFESDDGFVVGSRKELRMAFFNLITNAIRYTPNDGRIEVKWWMDDQGGHFAVTDDGEGIEPRHIARLTERFYRVDAGRSREHGGTGLGLAIVKQVLDRHDAKLYIQSELGDGSVFRCDFPRAHQIAA